MYVDAKHVAKPYLSLFIKFPHLSNNFGNSYEI